MHSKHLRLGAAVLGVAAIAGGATLHARATDVLPFNCNTGAAISGDGSSFQNAGVQAEITAYDAACHGGVANVTYTSTGSGKGIADFTARAVQFAGTDIPYSDAQWEAMQAGSGGNASHVETIPVALGAVGVAVNDPACIAASTQLSGATIGAIYAGKITNWNQVFPTSCPSQTITAYHRSGNSGTTTAFKTYLTKKDPADYAAGCGGTTCYKDPTPNWPAPGTSCSAANTNQAMVTCLTGTTGSIAYIDLSDAASAGITTVQVDNAAGPLGFSNPSAGACTAAAEANATPTTTSADWSQVDITDGPNGYAICTYTYQLAFNTPVHAGAAASASQAQTISNFISYEVSTAGQSVFQAHNYDALPPQIQALAQAAAQELLTTN
jgi:ABC-type phosphate transport system substrate-binding protein